MAPGTLTTKRINGQQQGLGSVRKIQAENYALSIPCGSEEGPQGLLPLERLLDERVTR